MHLPPRACGSPETSSFSLSGDPDRLVRTLSPRYFTADSTGGRVFGLNESLRPANIEPVSWNEALAAPGTGQCLRCPLPASPLIHTGSPWGLCPQTPGIFRFDANPSEITFDAGAQFSLNPNLVLAPESALSLLPSRGLSSAPVACSVSVEGIVRNAKGEGN